MNAIRVHEFGGPEQLQLEDGSRSVTGTRRRWSCGARRGRESGRHLHPRRDARRQAAAPVYARVRRRRRSRSRRRRESPPADPAIVFTSPHQNAGTYAERVVCAAAQVHPLPREHNVRPGRSARRPVCDRVPRTVPARTVRGGETVLIHGAKRRRRHRGRRARPRTRTDRHRYAAAPTKVCAAARDHGADIVVNHRAPTTRPRS